MRNVHVSVRVTAVVLGLVAVGCSDSGDAGGEGTGPAGAGAIRAALDGFTWADPPPAGDVKTNPRAQSLTAKDSKQNESVFECVGYDHETRGAYDKIAWLSEESGPVKPGVVLQGKAFREGQLLPVPLRRTPVRLSVNLAVPTASRTIDVPDTASIQDAISKFQQEADALSDTPGNVEFSIEEVTTKEQISLSLGVHASYSGLLASAKLETNITHEMGLTQHTVVARLIQPMYTVSFADEAIPTAEGFFDPSLTDAEWNAQQKAGTISADNPPVFISSVTYGRFVMVSLSSTQGETRDELKTLIEGSSAAFSASATLDAVRQKQWSTLKHQEYQRGGSANGAAEAMTSGDFTKFFGNALPSTMVPISFTVKTLSGNRKIARIGDLTRYTAPDCQTNGSWKAQTVLGDGAFSSIGVGNADDVWATSPAQPKKLFHFDPNATTDSKFKAVDVTFDPAHDVNITKVSVGRDGTVGMLLADYTARIYQPSTNTFTTIDHCAMNFDCNNGDRLLASLDIFDANTMVATNHEDLAWTSNGYATKNFVNTGHSNLAGIDQFNKMWHAPSTGGIWLVDGANGSQTGIGNLDKKIDSLAVGAPNDVWITYDGATYQYDPSSQNNPNQSAWTRRNMGTAMPILDVGVDGHLWGIGADGRIHRWLGLRP